MRRTVLMILFVAAMGGSGICLSGCGQRQAARVSQNDEAVIEWADEHPPPVSGAFTSVSDSAKWESFDYAAWEERGRSLPDAEQTIHELLSSGDKRLDRVKAVLALQVIGTPKSVPVLLEQLEYTNDVVRGEAIYALQRVANADKKVFVALRTSLLYYDSSHCRQAAADALVHIFGQQALEPLREHLDNLTREAKFTEEAIRAAEDSEMKGG